MAEGFYKETAYISRLRVPFDGIYTSVFLVETMDGAYLVDCATTAEDVDEYILPALNDVGYALSDLRALILTHAHADHAGGTARILSHAPDLRVIKNVCSLSNELLLYPMPGHTKDFIGLLDTRTETLISGDGLQGAGVDKYRCSTEEPVLYLETVEKIRQDERIKNLLLSHAYEPWYADVIRGRTAVLACLGDCEKYAKK